MRKLSPCDGAFIAGLIPEARSVLDVGCGRGDRLKTLSERGDMRLYGVERDPENAAAARENCPAAEIAEGDAGTLEYPSGSFDAKKLVCSCLMKR